MSPLLDPRDGDGTPVTEGRRDRFDGAGWFFAALALALVYGLGVSALSDGAGSTAFGERPADPTTVPTVRAALVVGDGP